MFFLSSNHHVYKMTKSVVTALLALGVLLLVCEIV